MSERRPSRPADQPIEGGRHPGMDAWRPGEAGAPSGTGGPVRESWHGDATPEPGALPGSRPAAEPGESTAGRLGRPPSERYARPEPSLREEPDHLRSLLLGAAAAAITALAWGVLTGVLDVRPGLLVVAVIGGWAIGAAVRWGAWGGAPHLPSSRGPLVAGVLGAGAWLGGLIVAWVVAQALLQGSARSLPERLAATPFLDWLLPQLGILEPIALVLLVGVAAYSARDR
jgi:hypothetical protein